MDTSPRSRPPSNPYPDTPWTLREGQKFERFVRDRLNPHGLVLWFDWDKKRQLFGENAQGVEVKLDRRCIETGQLSIEVAEKKKSSSVWVDSGIMKQDNSWGYLQGNYQMFWLFSKKWLIRCYGRGPELHESRGTVRKFYLPLHAADVGAIFVIDCTLPGGRDRIK